MLNLIVQVFRRYSARHLDLRRPGFDLMDDRGRTIGHVDVISLRANRLRVEGWCDAATVTLMVGEARSQTRPTLRRPDVVSARGLDPEATLGFVLDLPQSPGRCLLTVEAGDCRYVQPIAPFSAWAIRTGRAKLVPRFVHAGISVLPSAMRWAISRDATAKARIKQALQLNDLTTATTLTTHLFGDESAKQPSRQGMTPPTGLPQTRITIVLPVYNAFDLLPEVLDRVRRNTDLPWRLILIEDGSSDPRVRPFLQSWAAATQAEAPGSVTLIEHATNQGFIVAVNRGLALASGFGDHVVLLNSDAFVPVAWASRLLRPIVASPTVASVTPMSNDAEIFSVPLICQRSALDAGQADRLDAVAAGFNPGADTAIAPTGVGFCMAINHRYLTLVPQLDTAFGRGYGEEVDWCQKTRKLGGRHLGLPGLFVEHRGGISFGSAEKQKLVTANNAIISRRYPYYDAEVQDFIRDDPMATPRLALAIALAALRQTASGAGPMPIYLAHYLGGGAEDYLARRIADDLARGTQADQPDRGTAIVLRVGGPHRWRLELHTASGVAAGGTNDTAFVARLLAPVRSRRIVYSCGVGDSDPVELPAVLLALAKAGDTARIEVLFHDYLPISPSYTLLGSAGVYQGLPDRLTADPAHRSRRPGGSQTLLAEWQAAWGKLLQAADEITVFSQSSLSLVAETWPQAAPLIAVRPHRPLAVVPRLKPAPRPQARPVIGVLGNIGVQKGAGVLADLSRDLARNRQADLVVIGKLDPVFTLAPPARVHGSYQLRDLPGLVARYGITCWLMPSIWPETFSYVTHEALATGLPVWCFDLGAQAEAVTAATQAGAAGGVIPLATGPTLTNLLLDLVQHSAAQEAV